MTLAIPNSLANGTNADASKVKQNFDEVASYVNTNAILKDASVSFTGVPVGPATDPTTDNMLARKAYVDSAVLAGALGGDLSGTVGNAAIAAGAIVNADVNASAAIAYSKLTGVLHNGTTTNALVTISTSTPSGGSDGDIWFKY